MRYRPEIDGLRAIAVVPVILFHGGVEVFRGGFVGVDIFFVLSGYLITSILLNDLEQGRYSIVKFYERRARRILPALLFVVLCSLPFAYAWMLPSELEDFGSSLIGVALFISNILFWQESGYFEASAELKPMLHTWSLAVEEQYYIVFPVFLALIWRVRRALVLVSFLIVAALSLALAQWASENAPTANYYLAPMRFWEILAGSICAALLRQDRLPVSDLAAGAGLALVIAANLLFTAATPTPSVWTLIPVVGTMMIVLFAREDSHIARWLGNRAFVGIGLISYSAYLWHQPLFAFYRLRTADEPHLIALVAIVLATFTLAWFSWRWVEQPFRAGSGYNFTQPQILKMGAATLVTIGAIGTYLMTAQGLPNRVTPGGEVFADIAEVKATLRPNAGLHLDCDTKHFVLPPNCRTSPKPEMVLWGDSYAMHLAPALLASDTKIDFAQVTKSSCGPFPGMSVNVGKTRWHHCTRFNDRALFWIATNLSVKTVVVSSAFLQVQNPTYRRDGSIMDPAEVSAQMIDSLMATQKYLAGFGKSMLIISPPPQTGRSLGLCYLRHRVMGMVADECDFLRSDMSDRNVEIAKILRAVEKDIPVIWFDDLLCGDELCNTTIDDISIYRDSGHLSIPGSTLLGREVNLMGIIEQKIADTR